MLGLACLLDNEADGLRHTSGGPCIDHAWKAPTHCTLHGSTPNAFHAPLKKCQLSDFGFPKSAYLSLLILVCTSAVDLPLLHAHCRHSLLQPSPQDRTALALVLVLVRVYVLVSGAHLHEAPAQQRSRLCISQPLVPNIATMADSKAKRPPFQLGKKADLSSMMYTSASKTLAPKPAITVSKPFNPAAPRSNSHVRIGKNGLPVPKPNGVRRSLTPSHSASRQGSNEPREALRNGKKSSRSSPIVSTTPQWGSEDDDDDDDDDKQNDACRKRPRLEEPLVDRTRKIRDDGSFSESSIPYDIVHAADIANNQIQKHGRYQFGEYFTALQEDEEDCPTIELQYPCSNMTEKYQLVKPTDTSDFRPLSEIVDNMKMVKDFYLDAESADKVEPSELGGGGLVLKLERAAKDRIRAGAQQRFVDVVQEYNTLLSTKRQDGIISTKLDQMTSPLPLTLVQHIVKDQIYARTVSPHIDSVREYEGFSDNVYGELLPKFLSRIFQETHLKSNQIFVDLGSGVGNCVLQAALEVGCESWGCEMMPNPAKLAEAQAQEFPSRCRMWGIKPGKVHLIQDDFTKNLEILEVLKRADVVLVNNQAFNPELNDNLKSIFLELKEGCQVVSLKYFRDPAHRVKESNINDLVNCLSVIEKERFSGMVSWSDDPGKWYLHVKDSTELKAVKNRIEKRRRMT